MFQKIYFLGKEQLKYSLYPKIQKIQFCLKSNYSGFDQVYRKEEKYVTSN